MEGLSCLESSNKYRNIEHKNEYGNFNFRIVEWINKKKM